MEDRTREVIEDENRIICSISSELGSPVFIENYAENHVKNGQVESLSHFILSKAV
jgi:hypothetical protein